MSLLNESTNICHEHQTSNHSNMWTVTGRKTVGTHYECYRMNVEMQSKMFLKHSWNLKVWIFFSDYKIRCGKHMCLKLNVSICCVYASSQWFYSVLRFNKIKNKNKTRTKIVCESALTSWWGHTSSKFRLDWAVEKSWPKQWN